MTWQQALETTLHTLGAPLAEAGVSWAVIGSAASALQGCQLTPNDIDLLTQQPDAVRHISDLMLSLGSRLTPAPADVDWVSTREEPIRVGPDGYGFVWHFGRWFVNGIKVEAAHIAPPEGFKMAEDGAGIWEAGPEIWPYIRAILFAGHAVLVVPLEIQLQTNLSRGLQDRVDQILSLLWANGYDDNLLAKSIATEHLAAVRDSLTIEN